MYLNLMHLVIYRIVQIFQLSKLKKHNKKFLVSR